MSTLYEWLVAFHVLGAVVWVGGAVMMQVLAVRAQRQHEPREVVRVAGDAEWVGTRVLMPAAMLVIVAGVWAVIDGPWEFSQGWISAGFAVWFFSFVVGAGFLGPESGRIKAMMAASGADDPGVQRRLRRIFAISRIELVLLIAIIFVMVGKPGL